MTAENLRTLRRSPLGHLADVFAARSTAGERGVRLREVPFLAQLNLQLFPHSSAAERIASALGEPLPTAPNTAVRAGDLRVLWLGPQEWLLIGPDGSAPATADLLRAALADQPGSLVDVSANRTTLELAGPAAREVLEKGCALDLHPRSFGPGHCAQTLLSKVGVILHQLDAEPTYRLLVRGSFAQYLADWLLDAMEEYRQATR
ncbi:sarcosine oxidase subunit gamma [Kitasatospora sp. MAP12-15]|uniref:sarcosine oxidase subunit gamma n=1 Tax=unclassified Kitasatospora TaxID=2633591 RepID=UPI002472F930|nr:sarcosine oxidase subunit gamma family protein [Kitasatospora sp. MAP12-44]MDH6108374.1 sarcosine oxidase subunit gamma [Kitasatospora sp. MAP12-44]